MSASPSFPGAPEDPGCRVCEEGVLPRIRAFLMTEWDVRDPEAALTLVEAWKGAMPGHMHGMVLQSMVLPKVRSMRGSCGCKELESMVTCQWRGAAVHGAAQGEGG